MHAVVLLEDLLARRVVPVGGDLLVNERHALAVGRAIGDVRVLLAPDRVVVALGEGDGVRVGVLAAVELEDLCVGDFPVRDALDEALADELAHLDVVEADVVRVRSGECGSVVADDLDAMRLGVGLDLRAHGADRVHDQDGRTAGDQRLSLGELRRLLASGVVNRVLRRAVSSRLESLSQIRKVVSLVATGRGRVREQNSKLAGAGGDQALELGHVGEVRVERADAQVRRNHRGGRRSGVVVAAAGRHEQACHGKCGQ